MICEEIPVRFYIQKLWAYLSEEDKTIEGAKAYIGADDETFEKLLLNDDFKRLIDLM